MFELPPLGTSSIVYSAEAGYQHDPVSLDTAYRRGDFITAVIIVFMASGILAPGLNQILQNSVGVLVRGGQPVSSASADRKYPTPASERSETVRYAKSSSNRTPKFNGKWATSLQAGDSIAGYRISSAFGPRQAPCPGCSSWHRGTDVATPMYAPLYAVGPIGGSVNVRCWDNGRWGWVASYSVPEWNLSFDYVHLPVGECKSGLQKVGTVIAKSGTAGTGPHLHFQQRMGGTDGEKVPPQAGYIYAALTGQLLEASK